MQVSLVSLANIFDLLGFLALELQEFSWISFHNLEKSRKILPTLPKIIAKILARNLKNQRIFVARNSRFFLVRLSTSWIFLVFLPRVENFLDFFP